MTFLHLLPWPSKTMAAMSVTGFALMAGTALVVTSSDTCAQQTSTVAASPAAAASKALVAPLLKTSTKPDWNELTAPQKLALKPLAAQWPSLTEGQKRKWLAVSQNFASLPSAEQTLMHGRMTEWASLSAAERSQARLNYAGARELSADERQAKWQAYQALSDEQKRKLAATAPVKPLGAAIAVKPVSPQKLTVTPVPVNTVSHNGQAPSRHVPKIATAPHQVGANTLLPQPPAPAALAPVAPEPAQEAAPSSSESPPAP